ncbi:XylR N-terminal domain-containing protein [Ferviditalea candida]|uniref:XylR N-terminal domain-containing protein n=1 Tax=Ferviditalea candida TaxID=3108399 RepID=A0ABU5ZG16_9BACL|nr:XylR N-terminal domain-containing protein [Paenibacillaceae bacterium T2]
MKARDLQLESLIRFLPTEGKILIKDQRVITIPASALGTLRKDLIETMGMDRTKGFLLRYGWNCGASDGMRMKEMIWDSEKEILWAGPRMHMIHGYVHVQPLITEYDFQKGTLHYEGIWKDSYEAEEHVQLFGISDKPVCHTLVGYASGYLTTIMGKRVIAKEVACKGMGEDHCHWVCKTVEEWGGELVEELRYYEVENLANELDRAYERLTLQRDNLDKSIRVHTQLSHKLLYGNNLQSIANVLFEITSTPILIEDAYNNQIASAGMPREHFEQYGNQLKNWMDGKKAADERRILEELTGQKRTVKISFDGEQCRLVTPIVLGHTISGYCSFLYQEHVTKEVDAMILEQAALVCALYLFNEKTAVEAEQRLRGNFLEEILSRSLTGKEIMARARYIHIDLSRRFRMIVIDKHSTSPSVREELEFNDTLIGTLSKYFKDQSYNVLLGQKSGGIVLLMPYGLLEENQLSLQEFCQKLSEVCRMKYKNYFFQLGISSEGNSIEEAQNLYEEAVAALKVCTRDKTIVLFESLGIAGILFQHGNIQGIRKFSHKIIGGLIEYDKHKNMELTQTLYHYLNNGCNLHQTARLMNFSISGLRYRLQRLNEILQVDINDPSVRYQVFLALQALIMIGDLTIIA